MSTTEKLIPWGDQCYKTADQEYMISRRQGSYWSGHAKLGGGMVRYTHWNLFHCTPEGLKEVAECYGLPELCKKLAKIRLVDRIVLPRKSRKADGCSAQA